MVADHVDDLAETMREPFGTLILTLSVISIEIVAIVSIMLTGHSSPSLARDTMYSIIMILLNGVVGLSLLLGGLKYHEQRYNLRGSLDFLSVICVLSVIGLVLPNFTLSTTNPTLSLGQEIFLIFISVTIYGIFLGIQTVSHRAHFISPLQYLDNQPPMKHKKECIRSKHYHTALLIAYLVPTLLLTKQIAIPVETMTNILHAPEALGGLLVAILVLSPESVSAIQASLANQLQRSVNIALGSVLATTALTIPAVLLIGLLTHQTVILGLLYSDMTLLLLTLITSIVTFASGRASLLQGAIHLLLFFAYVVLVFD